MNPGIGSYLIVPAPPGARCGVIMDSSSRHRTDARTGFALSVQDRLPDTPTVNHHHPLCSLASPGNNADCLNCFVACARPGQDVTSGCEHASCSIYSEPATPALCITDHLHHRACPSPQACPPHLSFLPACNPSNTASRSNQRYHPATGFWQILGVEGYWLLSDNRGVYSKAIVSASEYQIHF
jgi:hypothetical protein